MANWLPPMAMKVLVELGVVEIMKKEGGYMSPGEIAGHLTTTNPEVGTTLHRIMRFLASHGMLMWRMRTKEEGLVQITYGLGRVEDIKDDVDASNKGEDMANVWEKCIEKSWYHMKDVVVEGGVPFNKAYGMKFFQYLSIDPIFNKFFNDRMSNLSSMVMKEVLKNYDGFKGISTLVDVGGGIGTFLNMIISKYPNIKGINYDLPQVIETAPNYPGIQHVSGDMFVSVPKGDAIILKWISHNWSDEHCLQILKNIYKALPSNGKLIMCDYILPVTPDPSNEAKAVFHLDLIMLTILPGAKERSESDFEYLAKASGFQAYKVFGSTKDKVIEFLKTI